MKPGEKLGIVAGTLIAARQVTFVAAARGMGQVSGQVVQVFG